MICRQRPEPFLLSEDWHSECVNQQREGWCRRCPARIGDMIAGERWAAIDQGAHKDSNPGPLIKESSGITERLPPKLVVKCARFQGAKTSNNASNISSNRECREPCKPFDFFAKFIGTTLSGRVTPDAISTPNTAGNTHNPKCARRHSRYRWSGRSGQLMTPQKASGHRRAP